MIKHYSLEPGEKWGALTIIRDTGRRTRAGSKIYRVKCACGLHAEISGKSIRTSKRRDCGCGAANWGKKSEPLTPAEWPVIIEHNGMKKNHQEWAKHFGVPEGAILGAYYAHKPLEEAARGRRKESLCWDCANACGLCSWSHDFTPVPGWDARATKLYNNNKGRFIDSYHVIECPEFVEFRRE